MRERLAELTCCFLLAVALLVYGSTGALGLELQELVAEITH